MKKDGGGRKKEERGRIEGKKDMGKENEVRVRNKAGGNKEEGRRSDAKRDRSERKDEAGKSIHRPQWFTIRTVCHRRNNARVNEPRFDA